MTLTNVKDDALWINETREDNFPVKSHVVLKLQIEQRSSIDQLRLWPLITKPSVYKKFVVRSLEKKDREGTATV